MTLEEAERELEPALRLMMSQSKQVMPFVILDCRQTMVFVQFRGSSTETLLLDVPLLNEQVDFGHSPSEVAYTRAREQAIAWFKRLQEDTWRLLEIRERKDHVALTRHPAVAPS
jgi:hypothetical protein